MITLADVNITTNKTGQNTVATLNGKIAIEEGRGRMVVRDATTNRELNVVDADGYTFSDATDRRIRIGNSPNRDRVGEWISKPGEDVIDLLSQ